ncbi:MAG TPA: hypothetical protein DCZ88_08060 [Pseudanabaena sp.]|nr:hypothetical protein [Pseudanabaena sp.]
MAPKFDNFLDGSVGGLGGAMGNYFKWNFSQSPAGISTYNAAANAGLKPSTAFGASLLTTAGLQYATNNALVGRDRDAKKPTFGDSYGLEDQIWDSTIGLILPNQGKVPRTYRDYLNQARKNGATDSQILTEDAYNQWKDAEYNRGGVFRINPDGQGSEIAGRDTATFFNRTVANPLYAYDATLGKENVDRLTAGIGLTGLAGSTVALKGYTDLAKLGSTVGATPAYSASQTAGIIGSSIAKGLGTAALVYGGITDFADSKKAGDSDLRASANAVSSTAGGLYGATQGAKIGSTFGPIGTGVGAIIGGLAGNFIGGWASDRAVDAAENTGTDRLARIMTDKIAANNNFADSSGFLESASALANRQQRSIANMATPTNNRYNNQNGTVINSSRSSNYALGEKAAVDYAGYQIRSLTDLQNYQMQSSDRRYATDRNADVNYQLGTQKNNVDYAVGMDRNAVTRDVGKYTSDNQLRASNYKTLADLQAALDKNRLQSGDNRYATDTQASTEKFKWTTVNPTSIAEAQIKAGTYGLSRNQLSKAAADKTNFDNWKNYNDSMFSYTDRMNAQIKLGQDIGQSQRAYNDQRNDRSNDQYLAMARYNAELAQKIADRNRYYDDLTQQRQLQRDDFNLRSRQIQNQIDIANKDYQIRYGDAKLRQDQFAAARADISYNRGNQSSSLAF